MGLLDIFRRKPSPVRKSGIQDYLEKSINKEARTPVYSGVSTDLAYKEAIMPPVDQNYLEVLADRYSHLRTVVTRLEKYLIIRQMVMQT